MRVFLKKKDGQAQGNGSAGVETTGPEKNINTQINSNEGELKVASDSNLNAKKRSGSVSPPLARATKKSNTSVTKKAMVNERGKKKTTHQSYSNPAEEDDHLLENQILLNSSNNNYGGNYDRKNSAAVSSSGAPANITSGSQASGRKRNAFETSLKRRNLELQLVEGDGNCLFRAVSLQVYGDTNMHNEVRRRCMDFMQGESEHFAKFIPDENFEHYIHRKRRDGVHGNNPEIQAISELYNRPVEVYVPDNGGKAPINIFHAEYKTADAPVRLSYHDGNHYNAIIDPYMPTAGLGLGLPGLKPGLADKMQMKKALAESDSNHVDYMYQKKAMAMSDVEATDYELEQAILASSLDEARKREDSKRSPSNSTQGLYSNFDYPVASSTGGAVASSEAQDEYPQCVQELVMNGFELSKVLRARDLVGDDFDDLLAFLMSSR
uniref:ubiquitinyl hydrolase 1 n=1 Tax=Leptocylindrus danicus TaxID=163516 RepID=A0A7S2K5T8_9STRA|mmetsp:Transcript_17423/g.25951  ORF Transcript_17423/g.25951 Transcript_17423/m.25951 type:complete len:437 (+) Transcript_17423:543-1853(+)|eukprot:CAMPEP_0116033012 /NCGR_PEP_ID=MMETSP0321-20121206/18657_1 /TAXON_ID=163516 /ORGANISM="Leptocylindrus danicus var. danicus, Strain B650" /LENGTH=436 /DNA_ID=CAMNT_0003508849 /DNA_START=469 /DNA_END=1779 /DNA_ORIENTATION=+